MSEQELTRAETERYDLETIVRFDALIARFIRHGWLPADTLTKAGLKAEQLAALLGPIHYEEGF